MKQRILCTVIGFSCTVATCYSQEVPSTAYADSLNIESQKIRNVNRPLATRAAKEALQVSEAISYQHGIVEAKLNLISQYVGKNQYDSALELLSQIQGRVRTKFQEGRSDFFYGRVYSALRKYEQAREYLGKAEIIFSSIASDLLANSWTKDWLAAAPNSLGGMEVYRGNLNEALTHFQRSVEIALQHGIAPYREYHNISMVYMRMKQPKKALEFMQNALAQSKQTRDTMALIGSYNVLGMIYKEDEKSDSALFYFDKSQNLAERYGVYNEAANAILNKATVFENQGQYRLALSLLQRSLRTVGNWNVGNISSAYHKLATVYKDLKKYDSAVYWARKSYMLGSQMNYLPRQKENAELLAKLFRTQKQYDSAFKYNDLFLSHNLEFEKANSESRFSDLRVQLETLEKENQIKGLQTTAQLAVLSRDRLILAIVLVVVVSALIVYALIAKQRLSKQRHELEQVKLKAELEKNLDILYQQTLSMISNNNQLEKIEETISALQREEPDSKLSKVLNLVKRSRNQETEWDNFNFYFKSVHTGFYHALESISEDLTMHDKRVCALIILNFSNREIATLLSIESKSVAVLKYRIKKKLHLDDTVDLDTALKAMTTGHEIKPSAGRPFPKSEEGLVEVNDENETT